MSSPTYDCVIVGAGVAGLVTARSLVAAGRSCVVLEARDRVGGRTLSVQFGGARLDLGGQWIGPRQPHIRQLLDELGLATFAQFHGGAKVVLRGGKRSTFRGALPRLSPIVLADLLVANQRLKRGVEKLREKSPPRELATWDATSFESWIQRHVVTQGGRDTLRTVARGVLAAEASELSFAFVLDYLRRGHSLEEVVAIGGGAQETRVVDGMQAVSERIAAGLGDRVRLSEPVRTIEQSDRGVVVRTAHASYRAQVAVVAVPPALCGRIHYEPALPARRDLASQRLPMGSAIKYVVQYDRPFWRTAGLSGEASTDGGVIEMAMDASTRDGSVAALVAFSVGAAARRWNDCEPSARRAAVIAELARLFGPEAATPIRYEEKSWLDDPWSRGCYVGIATPGTWTGLGDVLREPCGRIHWAGGETAFDWPGVDGAVESGRRAAREVHERLAAHPLSSAVGA